MKIEKLCLFIIGILVSLPCTVTGTTYFVRTNGSDTSNGTSLSTAWRTISHAVTQVSAGDTVRICGGVYRESVEIDAVGTESQPIVFEAYDSNAVVIAGSDVVTGWESDGGGRYKKTGIVPQHGEILLVNVKDDPSESEGVMLRTIFNDYDHDNDPQTPAVCPTTTAKWYEHHLRVSGSGYPKFVNAGERTCYYNQDTDTLYVHLDGGADPNTKQIEAGIRSMPFMVTGSWLQIKHLQFRHGNFPQWGGASLKGSNNLMEDCISYQNFRGGIMFYGDNNIMRGCLARDNGNEGICGGGQGVGGVIEYCTSRRNFRPWREDMDTSMDGGAGKLVRMDGVIIRNSLFEYNNGHGLWLDVFNTNSVIEDCVARYNAKTGFHIEISDNITVRRCVAYRNGYAHWNNGGMAWGIYNSSSNDCTYEDNHCYLNSGAGILVAGDGLRDPGWSCHDVDVHHNVLWDNGWGWQTGDFSGFKAELCLRENGVDEHTYNNTSDYNIFYDSSGQLPLLAHDYSTPRWQDQLFNNVPEWNAHCGLDEHSIEAAPEVVILDMDNDVNDDSDYGNNGTLYGAAACTGRIGGAYSFDGDDRIIIDDDVSLNSEGVTVMCWFKPDNLTPTRREGIIGKGAWNGGGYNLGLTPEGILELSLNTASGAHKVEVTASDYLKEGKWSHLAAAFNRSELKLYINGGLVGTKANSSMCPTGSTLQIGDSSQGGWDPIHGDIDEVFVYPYALAAHEIREYLAILRMDFANGTADSSEYDHTVNNSGSVSCDGFIGDGRSFNGSARIIVNNTPSLMPNNLTVECWFKPDTLNPTRNEGIIAKANNLQGGYQLCLSNAGDLVFQTNDSGVSHIASVKASAYLYEGEWAFLAGTFEGSTVRLYVNGVLVAVKTGAKIAPTSSDLLIGDSDQSGWDPIHGDIDQVVIYPFAIDYTRAGIVFPPTSGDDGDTIAPAAPTGLIIME